MSSTLSESSAWGSTVTIPSAGDLRNVSSVNTPISTLANRTQRLKDTIPGRAATHGFSIPVADHFQPGTARFTAPTTNHPRLVQTDVGGAGMIWTPLNIFLGFGGTITNISATVIGGSTSTHSALPATMPRFSLRIAGSTVTVLGTAIDASATFGAYDAQHTISLSLSETLAGAPYVLCFEGETGANSVTNALALLYYTITVTGTP